MKRLLFNLSLIFRPNYWIMIREYCKEWDDKFLQLIDDNDFEEIGIYTAKLSNATVWIENRPYGCFMPYRPMKVEIRPSRYAIHKGLKKLKKQEKELSRKHIQNVINQF